ncbi:MAG: DoxX family protein [Candidatus Omnitrophota bacterium]|jgi:putative oxidoreductase|nr:MAG: DoxX family protein [Candidatus Omnitrophota bacterium]
MNTGRSERDIGLLILRLGIGVMFVYHGFSKITGGYAQWHELGKTMAVFGITFLPAFWGFLSAFAEFFGGILLVFGLFMRPFAVLMAINMIVAASMHLTKGDGLFIASHAIEMAVVFVGLVFLGPGKFKLGKKE